MQSIALFLQPEGSLPTLLHALWILSPWWLCRFWVMELISLCPSAMTVSAITRPCSFLTCVLRAKVFPLSPLPSPPPPSPDTPHMHPNNDPWMPPVLNPLPVLAVSDCECHQPAAPSAEAVCAAAGEGRCGQRFAPEERNQALHRHECAAERMVSTLHHP